MLFDYCVNLSKKIQGVSTSALQEFDASLLTCKREENGELLFALYADNKELSIWLPIKLRKLLTIHSNELKREQEGVRGEKTKSGLNIQTFPPGSNVHPIFETGCPELGRFGESIKVDIKSREDFDGILFALTKMFPDLEVRNTMDQKFKKNISEIVQQLRARKNVILCGAPGTGKTFSVAPAAVQLVDPSMDIEDRVGVIRKYRELVEKGRILFTTFHPSMDYEDFVEGFKPFRDGSFTIVDGIFKSICRRALREQNLLNDLRGSLATARNIVKVVLSGEEKEISSGKVVELNLYGNDPSQGLAKTNKKRETIFSSQISKGDVILSASGATSVNGIWIVISDSLTTDKTKFSVKWCYAGRPISVDDLCNKTEFNQGPSFEILPDFNREVLADRLDVPFLLVIDEINRGNVSKTFGELITLLEPDKRQFELSEVSVTLPYSKESFTVPSNLYILATMNTADRSIGSMDYALRRRFSFYRLVPYPVPSADFEKQLFQQVSAFFVEGVNEDLNTLRRSKYLSEDFKPEDVWVGQSYFFKEAGRNNISERFKFEIKPILEEYINDGVLKEDARGLLKAIEEHVEIQCSPQSR